MMEEGSNNFEMYVTLFQRFEFIEEYNKTNSGYNVKLE